MQSPERQVKCETREPVWQKMWLNRPAVNNGIVEVSDAPGLGIELDWKMVEKYRIA